jgi:hypothetical protein
VPNYNIYDSTLNRLIINTIHESIIKIHFKNLYFMLNDKIIKDCELKLVYFNYSANSIKIYLHYICEFISDLEVGYYCPKCKTLKKRLVI